MDRDRHDYLKIRSSGCWVLGRTRMPGGEWQALCIPLLCAVIAVESDGANFHMDHKSILTVTRYFSFESAPRLMQAVPN